MKVLLVDDEKSMLLVLKKMLSKIPEVDITGSFQSTGEAFGFLKENGADLVFVDINMPGMNGFDFVTKYEELYRTYSTQTKVIMLTNSVLANEKKMAAEHESISDLWNKPLTTEKLTALMNQV